MKKRIYIINRLKSNYRKLELKEFKTSYNKKKRRKKNNKKNGSNQLKDLKFSIKKEYPYQILRYH